MAIMLYKVGNNNFDMNGDYTLHPVSCEATFNLNDVWQLDIDIPIGNEDFKAGAVISVDTPYGKRQLYRIQDTDRDMDNASATAYPIFLDSRNDCFLWDVRPTNKIGQDALDIMLAGSKYTGQSDITTASTAYYVQKNFIEALNSDDENAFLKRWGGEVAYQNFKIIVNNRLGADNGLRVEFGFNLTGLQEQVDMSNVVTRIIPKAFNGYLLPDNETVDSPLINNYPVVYTRVIEYQDVKLAEDATEEDEDNGTIICATMEELYAALRTKANAEFYAGIDLPNITYDVDMVDLSRTDLYKDYAGLLNVQLGDTVHVKNRRMGIETTARVITLVYDCITQKVTILTLGDYEANYFNDVSSTVSTVNGLNEAVGNIYDPNSGTVIAGKISGVINLLQTTLKAQKNIAQKQDVRAILFEDLDPDSPTYGALCIGTQGIQIAKERNETDTDWVWGTAIDFQSINADYIITGILTDNQGKFYLDMNTGELRMQDGTFVGTINGSTIIGGTIRGSTLQGGTISGGNIQIGNNFKVNANGALTASGATINGIVTNINGDDEVRLQNGRVRIVKDDVLVGYVGANVYSGDATKKGIVFDLEYEGEMMSWSMKNTADDDAYHMIMAYVRNDMENFVGDRLNIAKDLDMHNFRIFNIKAPNGYSGWTGEIPIITRVERNSDGTLTWYSSSINVSNGIITSAPSSQNTIMTMSADSENENENQVTIGELNLAPDNPEIEHH